MTTSLTRLLGLIPESVSGEIGSDNLKINFTDGSQVLFYHEYDCCESVEIDDIVGTTLSIIGKPLLKADIKESDSQAKPTNGYSDDSCTWTFLTLATIKGYIDVKFYGSSNGYYSEDISVEYLASTGITYRYSAYSNYEEQS